MVQTSQDYVELKKSPSIAGKSILDASASQSRLPYRLEVAKPSISGDFLILECSDLYCSACYNKEKCIIKNYII